LFVKGSDSQNYFLFCFQYCGDIFFIIKIIVMRKLLLILSIVSICISGHAQISRGSLFLGGDVNGGTQKTKEGGTTVIKQSGFYVSPVIGKAIRENLILGANAGFMTGQSKNSPVGKYETDAYSFGVFLRKYKAIGTSGFYLFLQAGLNAIMEKQDHDNYYGSTYTLKRTTIALNAYPGISYAVSKRFHLETGFNNLVNLNYFGERRESETPATTTKTNGFQVSSSLSNPSSTLFLGIRVLMAK
jgi:hypothetical protein